MRLRDAARYFDRTVCADAYTPAITFKAQLDLFDDSKRDGAVVRRRVLSVDADVDLPVRGVFTAHGDTFLIGAKHADSFNGSVIRKKYICHEADGLASVLTLDQAIRGLAGTSLYAARAWVKDEKDIETTSAPTSLYDLYVSPDEVVASGSIVTLGGRAHIVRNTYPSASGFLVCEGDEMPAAYRTAVVYTDASGQAYDAASDAIGGLAPVTCNAVWHRYQSGYEYLRAAAETFMPGDITVNVSKTNITAAGAGDTFTLLGDAYRVISVRDNGANVWLLHARRV